MRVLVTGGAGFIGAHLMKYMLENTDWSLICVDKLSYASKGWSRLKSLEIYDNPRLQTITWDLCKPFTDGVLRQLADVNLIIHMAAETHVDKSIQDPVDVISNNVKSTVTLLEYARTLPNLKMFQYFSTDEVFGPAPHGTNYQEWDRHRPTNPYSASKSASENICLAYQNTYKIPLLITNLMNAYGKAQHAEKFIPLIIKKLRDGEEIVIHTEPDGVTPGSRYYINVSNICSAIMFILKHGEVGDKYNIRGEEEIDNLTMVLKIADIMEKTPKYRLVDTHVSRPGHDNRYALDGSKLKDMGWKHEGNFDVNLRETVEWTLQNPLWLED